MAFPALAEPSACLLDSQTVETSANVPRTSQGIDAGKRIIGRKRHLGTDPLGLLLTVWVTAAEKLIKQVQHDAWARTV